MNTHRFAPFLAVLALALGWPLVALAQTDALAAASERGLEAYTSAHSLSNGYGDWHETGLRGHIGVGDHLLGAEIATMKRFGERGRYIGLSDTVTLDPDWFATLSVGAGDGAAYLPDHRVDAFINRKLLASRQLIATLGAGYYRAPDKHTDRNLSLGATYYFDAPWVVQGEIRFNESSPGQVRTHQQFVAATWGREHQTQVVVRHGWGDEGYQAIGGGASLVNFSSRQSQLTLRHWLGPQWGVSLGLERYSNPYYTRKGAVLALFWKLP
ncbi:YaiO family outer membrane beta-barrel protein [Hydrogenophaga sp. OTU3427]|uniref:YaiO family outer membrane beta-barrel protein n=1 Tax=Hydrogenophaga sp. OTU3427 TaxID=3043856 RepID=UPI00313EFF4A